MKRTKTQTGIMFSALVTLSTRIALKTAASPPLLILAETCAAVSAALYRCEAAPPPERRTGPDTGCAFPGSPASPSKTRPNPLFPRRGQGHPRAERWRNAGCSGGLCHTRSFSAHWSIALHSSLPFSYRRDPNEEKQLIFTLPHAFLFSGHQLSRTSLYDRQLSKGALKWGQFFFLHNATLRRAPRELVTEYTIHYASFIAVLQKSRRVMFYSGN